MTGNPLAKRTEDLPSRGPERLATTFFFVLFVSSIAAVGYLFFDYLTDAILAALFTVVALPFHERLVRLLPARRYLATTITTFLVVVAIAGPTGFLITSLSVEGTHLFEITRESIGSDELERLFFDDSRVTRTIRRASEFIGFEYTAENVKRMFREVTGTILEIITTFLNRVFSNLLSATFHFFIIVVLVFYLLLDGAAFKRWVFRLSPLPDMEEELLVQKFRDVGYAILVGNGLGSVLQGLLAGVAMAVVGLPSPVLWATVMSIFAFLPIIGIGIVVVPATIYLVLIERYVAAGVFFALTMAMGVFVENVVKTWLIGSHMKMHNFLVFMSIIGGIGLFGIIGILYGPLVLALFMTLSELYRKRYMFRFMTAEESAAAKTMHVALDPEN